VKFLSRCPLCFKRYDSIESKKLKYLLREQKNFLDERERAIEEREKMLIRDKEILVGNDAQEIKKKILLPSLKLKWAAEKEKIDADRLKAIKETPEMIHSIESMKDEMVTAINIVRKKPQNQANSNLLIQYEARLDVINQIISLTDRTSNDRQI
jgi:hypothetical protein